LIARDRTALKKPSLNSQGAEIDPADVGSNINVGQILVQEKNMKKRSALFAKRLKRTLQRNCTLQSWFAADAHGKEGGGQR